MRLEEYLVQEITFLMSGERMRLTRQQVLDHLRTANPEPIQTWAVEVEGRLFPVKQAFAEVTGANRSNFISQRAADLLRRLGFSVQQLDQGIARSSIEPPALSAREIANHAHADTRLSALRAAIDFYRDRPGSTPTEVVEAARADDAFLWGYPEGQARPI